MALEDERARWLFSYIRFSLGGRTASAFRVEVRPDSVWSARVLDKRKVTEPACLPFGGMKWSFWYAQKSRLAASSHEVEGPFLCEAALFEKTVAWEIVSAQSQGCFAVYIWLLAEWRSKSWDHAGLDHGVRRLFCKGSGVHMGRYITRSFPFLTTWSLPSFMF